MDENLATKVNEAFENLLLRINNDIKSVPVEDLEHVAHTLLQIMDFKNAMQNAEGNQALQERIMRTVHQKLKNGEGGFGIGFPPGFMPPEPPPQQ